MSLTQILKCPTIHLILLDRSLIRSIHAVTLFLDLPYRLLEKFHLEKLIFDLPVLFFKIKLFQ